MASQRELKMVYTPRIEDCVSFLTGKAAQQITRRSREALAELGITPVQYAVLNLLWERDGQSLAEIGTRLVLDSATMTGVADRLESGGLASRTLDPLGDRRVTCLQLTQDGKQVAVPAQVAMERVNLQVAADLGDKAADFWNALRQVGNVGETSQVPANSDASRVPESPTGPRMRSRRAMGKAA